MSNNFRSYSFVWKILSLVGIISESCNTLPIINSLQSQPCITGKKDINIQLYIWPSVFLFCWWKLFDIGLPTTAVSCCHPMKHPTVAVNKYLTFHLVQRPYLRAKWQVFTTFTGKRVSVSDLNWITQFKLYSLSTARENFAEAGHSVATAFC